jgi:hypothetical protein
MSDVDIRGMLIDHSGALGGVLRLLNVATPWYIWRYRLETIPSLADIREAAPCRRICPASAATT